MSVPDWWEALLLALAAWRMWYLVAEDDLTERPRRYVTRLDPRWEKEGDPTGDEYRVALGNFLGCPYCLGAWLALAWWGAWQIWPQETLVTATPFVLSALVVGAHKYLSS